MNPIFHGATLAILLLGTSSLTSSFAPCGVLVSNNHGSVVNNNVSPRAAADDSSLCMGKSSDVDRSVEQKRTQDSVRNSMASMATVGVLVVALGGGMLAPSPAFADEYGRESEAQFLGTGETVMICTKRGALGACKKTEMRTQSNDNDKADKYFQQPSELVKRKDSEAREGEDIEGNELIERLRKKSEDNSEKNELLVYQRTLLNDASASFGPFDSQVLILNEDGRGFTLLANPQAMRLKKAGFIENKKFIKQPTQEQIDDALEADGPNIFQKINPFK